MSDQATIVYRYGCPHWADPGGEFTGQLLLANRLWNRLVETERAHEEARAAIWATNPAVAAAQAAVNGADAAVEAAVAAAKMARQADRTTVPRAEGKQALALAASARAAAKAALKTARDAAAPSLRERFAAAKAAKTEAVKATYAEFVQEEGLGWGTYNDIVRRRFPAAVAQVTKRRTEGRPAMLRFRRFDGTGTLTAQVQHQAGAPPRTLPALNSGTHPKSGVLTLTPWCDPAAGVPKGTGRHGTLTLAFGRGRKFGPLVVTVPVTVHRYVPAGADIAEVKVTRQRVGTHSRLSVALVCKIPVAQAPVAGGVVAVRLGWKPTGDGRVRVASIGATAPLPPVPASLARVVHRAAGGMSAEVFFLPEWRALLDRDDGIRSIRDRMLDAVRPQVVAALKEDAELAETVGVTAGDVSRWRAQRRFAVLARSWPAGHPLGASLEAWRGRDRHLYDFESNERDQVTARRRDAWRCVAAWLCGGAGRVSVDGLDVAGLREVPTVAREDPERARRGRALAQAAAPGELREAILAAAERRGIGVTMVGRVERKAS